MSSKWIRCFWGLGIMLVLVWGVAVIVLAINGISRSGGGPTGKTSKNPLGMTFVELSPGVFTMGTDSPVATDIEKPLHYDSEKPAHTVTISKPFEMQTMEVTQAQWQAVMGDNPSHFKGDDRPVERVSWNEVQEFIEKLNEREPGMNYRLPTEAEWEYACRAGTMGDRYGDVDKVAWCVENSDDKTHPVGQKQPNAWGLYDMLGNVREWCADCFGRYPSEPVTDPSGSIPSSGRVFPRVFRGGDWSSTARGVHATARDAYNPGYYSDGMGFRLVKESVR